MIGLNFMLSEPISDIKRGQANNLSKNKLENKAVSNVDYSDLMIGILVDG